MTKPTPKTQRPARLLTPGLMLLLAVQFTYGVVFSSFLLLPKYLATVHRADPDVIGQMSGAAMFAAVAAVPLVSWLLARVGRGQLIVIGALLGAATAFGFAFLDAVGWAMLVLRLLQGVALVLVINASGTLVTDCVPKARLGQALGLWGLALLITNAIAPAVLEPVADHRGWDAVFYVAAAAGVVAAGLGAVVGARTPCRESSAPEIGAPMFSLRRLFLFGVTALMGTGLGTMFTFAQPFALHLGIDRVSGLFLGYTLGAVGARVGLGGFADRFGRARVSTVALVVYAASVLATAWLSYASLFFVGAGVGLAHGISYPAMNALAVEDTTERQRGAVMAYYNGAFNVGFAVSVTAFGELARVAGYPMVFLVAGGLVLLGAGALVRLPGPMLRVRAEPS